MEQIIPAVLTGLTIGLASIMFSRTRTLMARITNIVTSLGGSLVLTVLAMLFHLVVPYVAVSVIGALMALMILLAWRKSPGSHNTTLS